MQSEKGDGGRERSGDEGQGRDDEKSHEREVSGLRHDDVPDFGQSLAW